jgi:hypothetical protein
MRGRERETETEREREGGRKGGEGRKGGGRREEDIQRGGVKTEAEPGGMQP